MRNVESEDLNKMIKLAYEDLATAIFNHADEDRASEKVERLNKELSDERQDLEKAKVCSDDVQESLLIVDEHSNIHSIKGDTENKSIIEINTASGCEGEITALLTNSSNHKSAFYTFASAKDMLEYVKGIKIAVLHYYDEYNEASDWVGWEIEEYNDFRE